MSEHPKPKYVHKDNSASIFENSFKRSDDDPDVRGDGTVVCPCCNRSFAIRISGWIKAGKEGRGDWTSLRIRPVEGSGGAAPAAKPQGWRPGQPAAASAPPPTPQAAPAARRPAPRPPAPVAAPETPGPADAEQGVMAEDDVPF